MSDRDLDETLRQLRATDPETVPTADQRDRIRARVLAAVHDPTSPLADPRDP